MRQLAEVDLTADCASEIAPATIQVAIHNVLTREAFDRVIAKYHDSPVGVQVNPHFRTTRYGVILAQRAPSQQGSDLSRGRLVPHVLRSRPATRGEIERFRYCRDGAGRQVTLEEAAALVARTPRMGRFIEIKPRSYDLAREWTPAEITHLTGGLQQSGLMQRTAFHMFGADNFRYWNTHAPTGLRPVYLMPFASQTVGPIHKSDWN